MEGRNTGKQSDEWIFYTAIAGVVLIFIVLSGTALALHWDLYYLDKAYEENTHQIEQETKQRIEQSCGLLASPAKEECTDEKQAAGQETKRNEADLHAQRKMAEWAFGVGITAFISILLSLVGILFIWRSLKLNRDAVDAAIHANAVARDEQRAWVTFTINDAFRDSDEADKWASFQMVYSLNNVGHHPAADVFVFSKMFRAHPSTALNNAILHFLPMALKEYGEAGRRRGNIVYPNTPIKTSTQSATLEPTTIDKLEHPDLFVAFVVLYRTAGDGNTRHTAFIFGLENATTKNGRRFFPRYTSEIS